MVLSFSFIFLALVLAPYLLFSGFYTSFSSMKHFLSRKLYGRPTPINAKWMKAADENVAVVFYLISS